MSDGNGDGHGNPRPDLFHDRRSEGRRTAPYVMIAPAKNASVASFKHGGATFPSTRAAIRTPGKTERFSPAKHGASSYPGTLAGPLTFS